MPEVKVGSRLNDQGQARGIYRKYSQECRRKRQVLRRSGLGAKAAHSGNKQEQRKRGVREVGASPSNYEVVTAFDEIHSIANYVHPGKSGYSCNV